MTQKQLMKAYERCQKAALALSMAQDKLSRAATEFYGEELRAEVCGGGEIEFRRYNEHGFVDDFDTLRIEDLTI